MDLIFMIYRVQSDRRMDRQDKSNHFYNKTLPAVKDALRCRGVFFAL